MNILMGICGGIAAYRLADVTRELTKSGHRVRIILTAGAEKFVVPELFGYLGAEQVYRAKDGFTTQGILHIELARWCDKLAVAPLSAGTLSRLCAGASSDLLSDTFLAMEPGKPITVFPAMNSKMLAHPFTQENLAKLAKLPGLLIHPSESGELACSERGPGKLAAPGEIVTWLTWPDKPRDGKTALITTGATREPVDDVRYLTNPASGITGLHLAREFYRRGHNVRVIAGADATSELDFPGKLPGYHLKRVGPVSEMKKSVEHFLPEADVYISAAAVGDIRFPPRGSKIKKSELGDALDIRPTEDILHFVLQNRRAGQKVVGFAGETEPGPDPLEQKWRHKPVDLLVGTQVGRDAGFRRSSAHYTFCDGGGVREIGELSKEELARRIADHVFADENA